jgi:hypothetical protein
MLQKIIPAALAAMPITAPAMAETVPDVAKETCRDLVGAGWDHMPDVADYVKAQRGSDKLGYGSPCALES